MQIRDGTTMEYYDERRDHANDFFYKFITSSFLIVEYSNN